MQVFLEKNGRVWFLAYYDGCLRIPNHELMEKYLRVLARDSMGEVKNIVITKKAYRKYCHTARSDTQSIFPYAFSYN